MASATVGNASTVVDIDGDVDTLDGKVVVGAVLTLGFNPIVSRQRFIADNAPRLTGGGSDPLTGGPPWPDGCGRLLPVPITAVSIIMMFMVTFKGSTFIGKA